MSTTRFHEMFVNYAVHLTDNYENRISALEHEIKKLKCVIQDIRIESDHDLELDGSLRGGYDIRGTVDSTVYLDVSSGIHQEDIDIDSLSYCETCDCIYISSHMCTRSDTE